MRDCAPATRWNRSNSRGTSAAGTPGDLYLELQVVLPPADTDRARALYETMARELKFDPRAEMMGG